MPPTRFWRANLSQAPRIVGIGVSNRNNLTAEEHRYPHLNWGIGLIRGHGWIRYDAHGPRFDMSPGCAVLTPPQHTVVVHFEPHFRNHHCQFQLPDADEQAVSIAPVIQLGERFAQIDHLMFEAIGCFGTQPARAQALLWHLLWELTESPQSGGDAGTLHPALRQATRIVELQMHAKITATELARQVDVSYATLIRLFKEQFGRTIISYVRSRRMARAQDLLVHTWQPIKDIANEVGIADLQLFNKTVRRALGKSPRAIRQREP
ncbi:MAG: AraC family transcriptional regulator [Phycisphaeraceae bacterium]